ncbi:phage terminase large subunit [Nocardioides sp. 31GB23]|uniref:phage terminase large subunit n=1 Tax=Nocardioides sp. 31GB23 TaxID=3156065 RepID=UPI0032AF026C
MTIAPQRPASSSYDLTRVLRFVETRLAPERREQPWATPGEMAAALDRTNVQTPALRLIDDALARVASGETERQMLSMPPQEGKSQRISIWFPLWLLHRNPNLRIAIVSNGFDLARTFGEQIRDKLKANPQLGLTLSSSTAAKHEFKLLGYTGGVVCVGIEGSLTGRPVDVLIIDDPYKDDKQADSKAWRETVQNFWRSVALTRLAPGAPAVIVQTRWRQDDLSGWLQTEYAGEWSVLNIPAQADHDPEKGESDVLGRAPGEYMESARKRTVTDWVKKAREVGSRSWNAMYQGRPSPAEGGIIKRTWWKYYDTPLWLEQPDGSRWVPSEYDQMLQSWDMTFKDTDSSDYVVGQVWMRRGPRVYLLDQVRGRWSFTETRRQFVALSYRWPQAQAKLIEDKANGPAVMSSLENSPVGIGVIPEEPYGSKTARLSAVAPFVEAANVYLPDPEHIEGAAWVGGFVDEIAGFPTAAHDDQADGASQAINRLMLQPALSGELYTEDDLDDELAAFQITPY